MKYMFLTLTMILSLSAWSQDISSGGAAPQPVPNPATPTIPAEKDVTAPAATSQDRTKTEAAFAQDPSKGSKRCESCMLTSTGRRVGDGHLPAKSRGAVEPGAAGKKKKKVVTPVVDESNIEK